jgi:hypothetical protein
MKSKSISTFVGTGRIGDSSNGMIGCEVFFVLPLSDGIGGP